MLLLICGLVLMKLMREGLIRRSLRSLLTPAGRTVCVQNNLLRSQARVVRKLFCRTWLGFKSYLNHEIIKKAKKQEQRSFCSCFLAFFIIWRRERDSNPRYVFTYTRVPGVRLQPLGHLSEF